MGRLALGVAGTIVAPTLAETLAVNAKKYFFMDGKNPLSMGVDWATGQDRAYALAYRMLYESPRMTLQIENIQPARLEGLQFFVENAMDARGGISREDVYERMGGRCADPVRPNEDVSHAGELDPRAADDGEGHRG